MRKLGLSFALSIFMALSAIAQEDWVSQDEFNKTLHEMIIEIEERQTANDLVFNNVHAPRTLSKAMRDRGVVESLRHSPSWGSSVWSTWSHASDFYDWHRREFAGHEKHGGLEQNSRVPRRTLEHGQREFDEWKRTELQITSQLNELVGFYADLGSRYDRMNALNADMTKHNCCCGGAKSDCEDLNEKSDTLDREIRQLQLQIQITRTSISELSEREHCSLLWH